MLCKCGCGKEANTGKKYVWGHNGFNLTKEQEIKRRDCISKATKGKPCSEYRRQKLVEYNKNPENRKKNSDKIKSLYAENPGRFDNFKIANTRRRLGLIPSGNKGKIASAESKKRYSEATKRKWQNPEYVKKIRAKKRMSGAEIKFQHIIDKYNFPFVFNGNGEKDIIINGKVPDFICVSEPKLIEIFGDYWHKGENPQDRIELFKQNGYDCIVIWEKELKSEKNILEKVFLFSGGKKNA